MTTLRSRAIRLAYKTPDLRPHLLPLLGKTAASWGGRKPTPLTPTKVTNDLKKQMKATVGKYQPILGNVTQGVNSYKITPFIVGVSLQMVGRMTNSELETYWETILQALLDLDYTLIANVLSNELRVIGGPEALRIAKQNQIVAVAKLS